MALRQLLLDAVHEVEYKQERLFAFLRYHRKLLQASVSCSWDSIAEYSDPSEGCRNAQKYDLVYMQGSVNPYSTHIYCRLPRQRLLVSLEIPPSADDFNFPHQIPVLLGRKFSIKGESLLRLDKILLSDYVFHILGRRKSMIDLASCIEHEGYGNQSDDIIEYSRLYGEGYIEALKVRWNEGLSRTIQEIRQLPVAKGRPVLRESNI